ncbi:MAG: c-type cytochrome [Gemmatimonadaceae bacterium]|nr:c-type cytochrome [Gemmatimonadaceae bacterium]
MRSILTLLLLAGLASLASAPVKAQQATPDGKATFEVLCASCHSVSPPAKTAPPMTHVIRHYRQAFATDSAGIEAIVRWVQAPAAEHSKMPAHAIERFGLMPAFPLPEEQLRAVARYVWTLTDG